MSNTRIERDSMGDLLVPAEALYGAQTQRAVNNFPISQQRMPTQFIRALLLAKAAAAKANIELKQLDPARGEAIVNAVEQLLAGDFMQHFPVDIFQTGSGTSSNMNANEVIATLASRVLGDTVNPNDHVNCGQSSNDIIPTTIHVSAALALHEQLLPALNHLVKVIDAKAEQVHPFIKTGRTHLMDAMPVRMSRCWVAGRRRSRRLLLTCKPPCQACRRWPRAVPRWAPASMPTLNSLPASAGN